jgi:hypothetical protein
VLGGSFTGDLAVDPTHLRDLRRRPAPAIAEAAVRADEAAAGARPAGVPDASAGGSDRARRMRDAVEGALSDIILLGTEDQVRLAARAATELAQGRPVHTHDLVVALRDFIRRVLDLDPIPQELPIPRQGPTRTGASGGGRGKGEGGGGEGRGGGGRGMGGAGGMGAGVGMGAGAGLGFGHHAGHDDEPPP